MTEAPTIGAIRRSPVRFDAVPAEVEWRGGWEVVLAFEDEGTGPWLVDLSHRRRWDFQDRDVANHKPMGLEVPRTPGEVSLQGELMINRMNRTQVAVWHLGAGEAPETSEAPETPAEVGYTETTDAHCMLAVIGHRTPEVMEQVSNLDLFKPGLRPPFLTQGPVMHIPAQLVTCGSDCVLMTFSRGYGQTLADALLHAAHGCGLRPGGEKLFTRWLAAVV